MHQQSQLTITKPDDWHLHLRDGAQMASSLPHSTRCFARAILMPNLDPPIRNTAQALAYRERVLAALPAGQDFEPLMTLYLSDQSSPAEIATAATSPAVHGVKLYPAGATTNSEQGVARLEPIYPTLEAMQRLDLPLLVHGEATDAAVDIFDREKRFIDQSLARLIRDFPELRIIFEHITTAEAVQFVKEGPATLAATITPHHLLYNRNALLAGGVKPHFYCLPILKRETHRRALLEAATSANPKFFLGTDSAPHAREGKEAPCGCAGIFNAHAAIELYAEVFEQQGQLGRLEGFASRFGADFYRLPYNRESIHLVKEVWRIPDTYPFGATRMVPLRAGETLGWRVRA